MTGPTNSLRANCPACGASVAVTSDQLGSAVTCTDCLEEFVASRETAVAGAAHSETVTGDDGALQRLLNPELASQEPEGDALRIDDDLGANDEPGAPGKRQVLTADYDFNVPCLICGTRLELTDKDVGKLVKCPDCFSEYKVREPEPSQRRAQYRAQSGGTTIDDDDFYVAASSAASEAPTPYRSIADDLMKKAEADLPRQPIRPVRTEGSEALERAEAARDEAEEAEPPLPNSPFKDRLFRFLLDPNAIGRLVFLAGGLFILLGAIQMAIVTTDEGGLQQFLSVLMRMFAMTFGMAFLALACTTMQGIVQDTSNGLDEIVSWPDLNFLDWFGDMFYILSGLFISVVPFVMLAKVSGASETAFWAILLGGGSAGLIFAFPVILLSLMEAGSPINPISRPIQQSLRLAPRSWFKFTLLAMVVVGIAAGLAALRIARPDITGLNLGIAAGLVVLAAIYFRLLGRLAWCCRIAVADEETRLEELQAEQEL